jgi:hypothetical protein
MWPPVDAADLAATELTQKVNKWYEDHLLAGEFYTDIKNTSDVDDSWAARDLDLNQVGKVVQYTRKTENTSRHMVMLATSESKSDDGKFDFNVSIANKDLRPVCGRHQRASMKVLSKEWETFKNQTVSLRRCHENVGFRIIYVDTQVCH